MFPPSVRVSRLGAVCFASILAFGAPLAVLVAAGPTVADFEAGAPPGFFTYNGGASAVASTTQAVGAGDPLARPGQVGSNGVLVTQFTVGDFGGLGVDLSVSGAGGPQDWSGADGFGFWFHGANTGLVYQAEIFDNRSNPNADTAERFDHNFVDNALGWRYIRIPFSAFSRATDFQPGGAPNDGLTLTQMWGWAIILPNSLTTSRSIVIDDVGALDHVIDDFETGLPAGTDTNGVPIGFFTFQGPSSTVGVATASPATILTAVGTPNQALKLDFNVTSFAGVVHNFQNPALNAWVPQDWSRYEGFAFWIQGTGSGTTLFVDIIENRSPGSTRDDAERWSVSIFDTFTGWRRFSFPFTAFARKEIGNGAPNDGLTLREVHGWAVGALGTGGPRTYYLDQVTLFGAASLPPLAVSLTANTSVTEAGTAVVAVKLNRAMIDADPEQVSVSYAVEPGTATPDRDYTPVSGMLTFTRGGPIEKTFAVPTLGDVKYEGTETAILRLSDPVQVALAGRPQAILFITDDDALDPALVDDFEIAPDQFTASGGVSLTGVEIAAGDPMAVPGQGPYEGALKVHTPILVDIAIRPGSDGRLGCPGGNGVVPVAILTTSWFDATTVDHASVRFGNAREAHVDHTGAPLRHVEDVDHDGDRDLVLHFRFAATGFPCDAPRTLLTGQTIAGRPIVHDGFARFGRDFAMSRDWSQSDGLSFWHFGTGTGDRITVQVLDNRAPDPGPDGWTLSWSDEFNGAAGTPPDPRLWAYEIGDGSVNGIPGWGNDELQYYTNAPGNVSMDGQGRLVIAVRQSDGSLPCYYGPCQYTSARLKTQGKREFGFGRVESRIRLPRGAGLWPAFWSLGTTIGEVGWPQTGEIDIMEFVGRRPQEIFGTIHGPGYSGGSSFAGIRDFGRDVSLEEHTFAVEWEPGEIRWYVDGAQYHRARPSDIAPNQWVFDHPFFLLLNMAIGGNFGGPVGPDATFPQTMAVDYVRVYRAPDTAERFDASFVDDVVGWRRVTVPFADFARSAHQPVGAPNDGFGLSEVWGYGFVLPEGGTRSGALLLSEVRLIAPTEIAVVAPGDGGAGSLRQAVARIAAGGTITFDPALAGQTIVLTSGPLTLDKGVTIDGASAPGLTLSGGRTQRVLIVNAGVSARVSHLTIADGFGFDLAGGILNNGNLTLDAVLVRDNRVGAVAGDFWKGGGGIYNGGGSTLMLMNSTVRGNTTERTAGAGIYAFFNAAVTIENSTINGNTAGDVGGAIRSLGNVIVRNSTLSGNVSQAWHGGALFHTDGVLSLANATIAGNTSPAGTAAVFVGTFTAANATLTLGSSIVADAGLACFVARFGSGTVTLASTGYNIATDGSCNLTGPGDLPSRNPLIGPLAGNGGPTETHALLPGSPAIDAANPGQCPATDQRGVARPQGAGCDIGAFERQP